MHCHFCEQEKEGLPFRCNYCANYFCSEHRLPENHACPRIGGPKQPGYANVPALDRAFKGKGRENSRLPVIRSSRSRFRLSYSGLFSRTEQKHLLLAVVIVVPVGLSITGFIALFNPLLSAILVLGFVVSFVGHELAHKFTAQRNGLWAEFRTNPYGIMMTIISMVPFFFKYLAPGQVNVIGNGNRATLGMIAFVGPGFNVGLGWVLFAISHTITGWLGHGLGVLTIFNGWMAIWNLIPIGVFDGAKVYEWDKIRWIFLVTATVALIVVYFVSP